MSKTVPELAAELKDQFVEEAKLLEEAGASLLDFTNSGPVAGPAVTQAVSIPVIGGLGGGPWLDGRVRAIVAAIGYTAAALDDTVERYANVARITLDAITAYAEDVRAGRQIRGGIRGPAEPGIGARRRVGGTPAQRTRRKEHHQYVTRTRYFSIAVPSAATGTVNCAAHAAVFVHSCDERSIRHVPPIGSFTSTVIGAALWLRSVISYSTS